MSQRLRDAQKNEALREKRGDVRRLLEKQAAYSALVYELLTLKEDGSAVAAIRDVVAVTRDLAKAGRALEALAVEPEPIKDKVPDVDPPPRERATA